MRSSETCRRQLVAVATDIKWMSWNAAWHAANLVAGFEDLAEGDLERFELHAAAVMAALPPGVALHVRAMVWSACWHAARANAADLRCAAMEESEAQTEYYSHTEHDEDDAENDDDEEEDDGDEGGDEGVRWAHSCPNSAWVVGSPEN